MEESISAFMELRKEEFGREAVIMPFTKKVYTIADIEALPEGVRAELINGEMYMMASPTRTHQKMLIDMTVQVYNYIASKEGRCEGVLACRYGGTKGDHIPLGTG